MYNVFVTREALRSAVMKGVRIVSTQTIGLRVAGTIFGLIAVGQLTRFVAGVGITVAGFTVPLWPSAIATIILVTLCVWMWRLSLPSGGEHT